MTLPQHIHTPVLPPLIPGDPQTDMWCDNCRTPRRFTTHHVPDPPQQNAIHCIHCGKPTWLLCTHCRHPYQPASN